MTIADINEQPRGCATDGKSHLNLTRSLADVWGAQEARAPLPLAVQPVASPKPSPRRPMPFAGYDPTEVQVKRITQGYAS